LTREDTVYRFGSTSPPLEGLVSSVQGKRVE
jgi:hypothetical protein